MQSLDILSKETIDLLEKNQILSVLIFKELTKNCISDIEVTDKDKVIAKQIIINKEKIKSEEDYNEWLKTQYLSEHELLEIFSEPPRV